MLAKRVLRGGPPGAGTAGLKLPTEARAFEDPMRRTHSAHAETHSREPIQVQVVRKSGQEDLLHTGQDPTSVSAAFLRLGARRRNMLCDRWASMTRSDKPKVSTPVVALRGPPLSIQHSPWLPCFPLHACGVASTRLGVLDGRGVHLGMCGFVLGRGSE